MSQPKIKGRCQILCMQLSSSCFLRDGSSRHLREVHWYQIQLLGWELTMRPKYAQRRNEVVLQNN